MEAAKIGDAPRAGVAPLPGGITPFESDVFILVRRGEREDERRGLALGNALEFTGRRVALCSACLGGGLVPPGSPASPHDLRALRQSATCLLILSDASQEGIKGGLEVDRELSELFDEAVRVLGPRYVLPIVTNPGLLSAKTWRGPVQLYLGSHRRVQFLADEDLCGVVWSSSKDCVIDWMDEQMGVEYERGSDFVKTVSRGGRPAPGCAPCGFEPFGKPRTAILHEIPSRFMPWLRECEKMNGFVQHECDREWRRTWRTRARVWRSEHGGFVNRRDARKPPGDPSVEVFPSERVPVPLFGERWVTQVPMLASGATMGVDYDGFTAREVLTLRTNITWFFFSRRCDCVRCGREGVLGMASDHHVDYFYYSVCSSDPFHSRSPHICRGPARTFSALVGDCASGAELLAPPDRVHSCARTSCI